MKYPPNYQTTSTQEKLSQGPADRPKANSPKPAYQTTSSQITLGRAENPVAQTGNHPHMGAIQSNSTKAPIGRSAEMPYDKLSATKPQVSIPGKKKR